MKTVLFGLVASISGAGFQSKITAKENKKIQSAAELTIEELNTYLHAVFTHLMSLQSRKCNEVNAESVQEASYHVVAMLSEWVKNFRITSFRYINPAKTHAIVEYETTHLASGKVWIEKFKVRKVVTGASFEELNGKVIK